MEFDFPSRSVVRTSSKLNQAQRFVGNPGDFKPAGLPDEKRRGPLSGIQDLLDELRRELPAALAELPAMLSSEASKEDEERPLPERDTVQRQRVPKVYGLEDIMTSSADRFWKKDGTHPDNNECPSTMDDSCAGSWSQESKPEVETSEEGSAWQPKGSAHRLSRQWSRFPSAQPTEPCEEAALASARVDVSVATGSTAGRDSIASGLETVVGRLESSLSHARVLRRSMVARPLGLGPLLSALGLGLLLAAAHRSGGGLPPPAADGSAAQRLALAGGCLLTFGYAGLLLAVLPSNRRGVLALSLLLGALSLGPAALLGWGGARAVDSCAKASFQTECVCRDHAWCWIHGAIDLLLALILLGNFYAVCWGLAIRTPRRGLRRLHALSGCVAWCIGLFLAIHGLLFHFVGSISAGSRGTDAQAKAQVAAGLLLTVVGIVLASCTELPGRVQWWLASQELEATATMAGLSAFLGGRRPPGAVAAAKPSLRAVSMERVLLEDLSSRDVVERGLGLAQYSVPVEFGSIDAFVSHSWHDDVAQKWEALQSWRQEFKSRYGREPRVWLDKYCRLPKASPSHELASLPAVVASSRELVVLRGLSFWSRLWCVMEVVLFFQMGATMDAVRVVPVGPTDHCSAANFDVRRAGCSDKEELDLLLSIVEAGYGGVPRFNKMVDQVVRQTEPAQTAARSHAASAAQPVQRCRHSSPPAQPPQQAAPTRRSRSPPSAAARQPRAGAGGQQREGSRGRRR